MDYFDLAAGYPSLAAALERARSRFLVISFTSDWLYPSYQSQEIVNALRGRNHDVTYCELSSNYGHDAFLVDIGEQTEIVRGFLAPAASREFRHAEVVRLKVGELFGRSDYALIGQSGFPAGSKVLDLGCGDGASAGVAEGQQTGGGARRVELRGELVQKAIARGVTVYQGDLEASLKDYPGWRVRLRHPQPDLAGDTASATWCWTRCCASDGTPIVAFPNFGHWRVRLNHLFSGRAPKTGLFPFDWYDSPNIHFLTVIDFEELVQETALGNPEDVVFSPALSSLTFAPNWSAEVAVYLFRPAVM